MGWGVIFGPEATMKLTSNQIGEKREIGSIGKQAVHQITTKGGLVLIVVDRGAGKTEILGAGPHAAVARSLARKREQNLKISELHKADAIQYVDFAPLLPYYTEVTDTLRRLHGDE